MSIEVQNLLIKPLTELVDELHFLKEFQFLYIAFALHILTLMYLPYIF